MMQEQNLKTWLKFQVTDMVTFGTREFVHLFLGGGL